TATQSRVDRPAWQVEQVGDLARRVLEQVAEHDHGSVIRVEGCERGQHPFVRLRALRRGHAPLLGLGAELRGASPVDRAVDRDPVQPRAEGTAAVEAVERAYGGEKRLLCDVLGRRGVVHDEIRGAVGARPVLAEEGLEIRGRSTLRTANPRALRHPPTLRRKVRMRSIRLREDRRSRARDQPSYVGTPAKCSGCQVDSNRSACRLPTARTAASAVSATAALRTDGSLTTTRLPRPHVTDSPAISNLTVPSSTR